MRALIILLMILPVSMINAADKDLAKQLADAVALGKKEYKSCSGNHWKSNPNMPARNPQGRMAAKKFFAQFADATLEIEENGLVPDANFGTYKPGDQFANSWIVKAEGQKVGVSHKTAPWIKAVIECEVAGKTQKILIKPDGGCGCGGTTDWIFNIPFSAPSGTHKVVLTWEYPQYTKQTLRREYSVTIENDAASKSADDDLAELQKQHGQNKVLVFQNGLELNGETYDGVDDMSLSFGGYEGDRTGIIQPQSNVISMGYWIVNKKASYYSRGMIRFDLEALKGKKVKAACLKLSIKQNQKYLPPVLKQSFPIYAMKKTWKEGESKGKGRGKGRIHIDKRGLAPGLPNVYYQAYPIKWSAQLASSDEDRSEQMSELVVDAKQTLIPGARADVTGMVQQWASGSLENHGFLIGADLPEELNGVHPGLDGQVEAYRKIYNGGAVPFISSDEPVDTIFSPRLIVVLE